MSHYTVRLSTVRFSNSRQAQSLLARVRDYLANWRRRQEIISELHEFSPRELAELGIRSADIPYVAESTVFAAPQSSSGTATFESL